MSENNNFIPQQKPYVALTPFHLFIKNNFPFIEDTFEALDNYGLYCKLVEYLNKVIANENVVTDNTRALYNAFVELNNYVSNYFDNLDVQEEINNKLDEMVEEGTLQEIVAAYLSAKAVFGYDNVADMKNATNLIDGSYARTLGYYTKSDGGAALYKIRNVTNNDVIDEMFLIEMNDSENELVAELIIENETVNVRQLGAKGDNETDDTSILQAAANYASDNDLVLYIPEGEYLTDTITLEEIYRINIEGTIVLSDSNERVNIYENVNSGKIPDIKINSVKIGSIVLEGINSAHVSINYAKSLILYAVSVTNKRFIGYTTFELGDIESLKIKDDGGTGPKWVNENLFIGGRFLEIEIGGGDSNYNHQHNLFFKPMCEHTVINFIRGIGNRIIDARLEGEPTITFGAETFANVITSNYASTADNYYRPQYTYRLEDYVTDNSGGKNKVIANEDLTEHLVFSLNKFNPNGLTVSGDNVVANGSTLLYETDYVSLPTIDTCLYINSSNKNIAIRLECYDETFTKLSGNPNLLIGSSALPYSSAGTYGNASFNRFDYWALMDSSKTSVKYVKLKIYCPSGQGLSNEPYKNIDIYLTHYGKLNNEGYYLKGFGTPASI